MVAFMVKPEIAAKLALPGGENAEDLHMTLAFMGNTDDDPPDGYVSPVNTLDNLRLVLSSFAKHQEVLNGATGGIGRFSPSPSSDEASPVIALVNVPGLQEFRRNLVETLETVGYFIHKEFDYLPHMTLAYLDPDAPMPADDLPALPLIFDELCLAIGDDRYVFPIGKGNTDRSETPDVFRRGRSAWRPPTSTQLALETKLATAIKEFLSQAQITRNGATPPGEAAQTKLLEEITDLLEQAVHEGRRIATDLEERGLISAAKNVAGRAVQVISGIIEQLAERAQILIDEIFGGGEDIDPDAALSEVEDQIGAWATDYSDMVATTEITTAVEETVLDAAIARADTKKSWNAESNACVTCLANADASPIPINAAFPDGSSAPPGHPRCRCSLSTA